MMIPPTPYSINNNNNQHQQLPGDNDSSIGGGEGGGGGGALSSSSSSMEVRLKAAKEDATRHRMIATAAKRDKVK